MKIEVSDLTYPKISVITPSFNQAEFIERTIQSVIYQDYPNLEYIIIDGGSTDGSIEIIKKYERHLAYWVSEKDRGQADAIRKGFEKATGDILCWLNSDDLYLPDTLMKVGEVFKNTKGKTLVYGNQLIIDQNDVVIGEKRYVPVDYYSMACESTIGQPNVFWSKEAYWEVGGINPKYNFCMDLDLFIRLISACNVVHIKEHLACFRLHYQSKTSTISHIHDREKQFIQKLYLGFSPIRLTVYRNYYLLRRIYKYLIQGDIDYCFKGILRRFFNKPQQFRVVHYGKRINWWNDIATKDTLSS